MRTHTQTRRRSARAASRPACFTVVATWLACAAGCASLAPQRGAAAAPDSRRSASATTRENWSGPEYKIHPPDEIVVHAHDAPELDQVRATVRSDGKIVLPLVGEIDAGGATVGELAIRIQAVLENFYVEPEVRVFVSEYRSPQYFVFGDVLAPGAFTLRGDDTLWSAVARAKPSSRAAAWQVRWIRPAARAASGPSASGASSARETVLLDLDALWDGRAMPPSVRLAPGDILEVRVLSENGVAEASSNSAPFDLASLFSAGPR